MSDRVKSFLKGLVAAVIGAAVMYLQQNWSSLIGF